MSDSLRALFAALALLPGAAPALAADAPPLSAREAVQRTVEHNPTLQAAVLDLEKTAEALRAESARYRPSLLVDATVAREATPGLDAGGGTSRTTSRSLVLGAEVVQTFSTGTRLELRMENRTYASEGPSLGGATTELGPGYGLAVRFGVAQPLLRGFGDEIGEAGLRAARLTRTAAERARDVTASEALGAVLQAFWELWYAQKAQAIEEEARSLVMRQRDEAQRRLAAGALADVDLLVYETRLAERAQSVLAAEALVRQRAVALRRAMGEPSPEGDFDLSAEEPPPLVAPDAATALAEARASALDIAQSVVEVERAEEALRTAGESTRPRLDLQAWVQAQGLGNDALSPAFEQLGGAENVSANVGLVFELPLSGTRNDAERRAAALAVPSARARLEAVRQRVAADTATTLDALVQASGSVILARRTAEISRRSLEAQEKRLAGGAGIALEVREAEDALRRAQLAVERARVDGALARVQLDHLTGRLLESWAAAVPQAGTR